MYKAINIDAEINYQDFYGIAIHYNIGNGCEDNYYYEENIPKLIGMTLEEYRNYCRKNFNVVPIFNEIFFELKKDTIPIINWLNEKLVPLNVLEKLSKGVNNV